MTKIVAAFPFRDFAIIITEESEVYQMKWDVQYERPVFHLIHKFRIEI
jgi:hypothetical protein